MVHSKASPELAKAIGKQTQRSYHFSMQKEGVGLFMIETVFRQTVAKIFTNGCSSETCNASARKQNLK
jgi:hypothetical protein